MYSVLLSCPCFLLRSCFGGWRFFSVVVFVSFLAVSSVALVDRWLFGRRGSVQGWMVLEERIPIWNDRYFVFGSGLARVV